MKPFSFFIRHPCSRLMPRLCDTTAWKWRDCTAEFYSNTFFFQFSILVFQDASTALYAGHLESSILSTIIILFAVSPYDHFLPRAPRMGSIFFWEAVFTCLNWEVVLFLPQLSRKGRGALQSIPPRPVVIYRPRDEFEAATGRPRTEQWILTRPLPSRVGQV